MKLTIGEKIKLTAITDESFENVQIYDNDQYICDGRIDYMQKKGNETSVNYIKISKYSKENIEKFIKFAATKNVNLKSNMDIKFRLDKENSNKIKKEIGNIYDEFFRLIMNGEIEIKIGTVGCEYPTKVLAINDDNNNFRGIRKWTIFYYWMENKYKIYDSCWTNEFEIGKKVTKEVIEKINKIRKEKEEQKENNNKAKEESGYKVIKTWREHDHDENAFVEFTKYDLRFYCRNIFDFGFVVNSENGGVYFSDYFEKNGEKRKLTDEEKKCLEIINKFPPISTEIRM